MSGQVTDAMVELAAIAAYENWTADVRCLEPSWNTLPEDHKQRLYDCQRAALEAVLSAAPASPQPQGADQTAPNEDGISYSADQLQALLHSRDAFLVSKGLFSEYAASIPHPQPSGNGLSEITDEMVEAAASGICAVYNSPIPAAWEDTPPAWKDKYLRMARAAILAARAVEARVRSQPVQQGGTEREKLLEKALANSHEVFAAEIEALQRQILTPTPTDEWRRAVEACAAICDRRAKDRASFTGQETLDERKLDYEAEAALNGAAREIRALSPAKPDDGAPMPTGRTETR